MKSDQELKILLYNMDHKSYPAYKSLKGAYRFPDYIFTIDHVQGDPFASPSKISILIEGKRAAFPKELFDRPYKKIALEDYLLRLFGTKIRQSSFQAKGSGKSGLLQVSTCGQEVLSHTACQINPHSGDVEIHMEIGFPANGRTIHAGALAKVLFELLPACVQQTLFYPRLQAAQIRSAVDLSEDQHALREYLTSHNLCAFIANGSILPRESGVSQRPMKQAVPFISPASLSVTISTPHKGVVTGMGIPKGISLIVGGGYHGKSTLLKALELGVYNHIAGDGREFVITDDSAVKIRAEDGRSIRGTDISYFIRNLPDKKDTQNFFTEDASGSTSQAAGVIEAMEAGSRLLLIDEDTSATNFMIRDELMQRVVHRDQEPIIPFIERVEKLYEQQNVSTILVAGSSGSYFHNADRIIQMDQYIPKDITAFAKEEAKAFPPVSFPYEHTELLKQPRTPSANQRLVREPRLKCKTLSKDAFQINHDTIDLRYVEQLADYEQTQALMYCLLYAERHLMDGKTSLPQIADRLLAQIEEKGLASILDSGYVSANLVLPRRQEILACLNRYRSL